MLNQNQLNWVASSLQTFVSSFLTVLGATLANGNIEWTWAFWGAISMVAVRAAIKAVFQNTTIPALGGKR
jgi:hypothetical protein